MNAHQRRVARRAKERRHARMDAYCRDLRKRFLSNPDACFLSFRTTIPEAEFAQFRAEWHKMIANAKGDWRTIKIDDPIRAIRAKAKF